MPRERYLRRAEELEARARGLSTRLLRLGTLRIVSFFAAIGLWGVGDWTDRVWLAMTAVIPAAVFLVQVRDYRRTGKELERARVGGRLARQGVARLERRWEDLPEPAPAPEEAEGHRYAGDLDLFGRASLWSLLGPVQTPMGRDRLHSWLLEPSPAREVP